MTSISPNKSYLFKLPPEIRNDIFRLAFVQDEPIPIIIWRYVNPFQKVRGITPQPVIAATCKQVRTEVLSIYYGENTFELKEYMQVFYDHKGFTGDLCMFKKWAFAARDFGRFLTSIGIAYGYPDFRILKCTEEVSKREHGSHEFQPDEFRLSAITYTDDDGVKGVLDFKLSMSGTRFTGMDRRGLSVCVCIIELASRGNVHPDETLQLRGDVKDVGPLNGTLRAVSTILKARSVEICCSCHLLMLRT